MFRNSNFAHKTLADMKLSNFGHYLKILINSIHTVIIVIFMEIILKPLNLNDKSSNVSMTVIKLLIPRDRSVSSDPPFK